MLWTTYLIGAALTLLYKWGRFVYIGKASGKSVKASTAEWFFEPSLPNATSWAATIGCVWLIGAAYVDGILVEIPLPHHNAIAFTLGAMMEITAPNAAKWLLSKLPG